MTSPTTDRRYGVNTGVAFKSPCRAATTANITLNDTQTIDGVALVAGDRCLVLSQTSSIDNGVYVVDTGAWTRDVDFDGTRDIVQGTLIFVIAGTAYAQSTWQVTTANPITVGTSALTFSQANNIALAALLAASPGSGLVGFLYSLTYGAGTIGKWLKDLATSAGSSFIGFIQAGTGAVLRTMQDKNRDFINAADFGFSTSATATANTTALVAALASLGSTGGTVFINKGTFNINPDVIALTNSQLSITICGAANCMGYADNTANAATVLKFTAGTLGFDFTAAAGNIAAGNYIRLCNVCINGNGVLATGVKITGLVLLDHMNVSQCTSRGIWLYDYVNSTSLNYVSCTGNTGAIGLLIGFGGTTLFDNTPLNVSKSVFRQNLNGVRVEQCSNYSFRDCVIESNAGDGLILYRWHQSGASAGHDQNANGVFDTVWLENNSAGDDVHCNLLIDAGTRSLTALDTPSNIVFENCMITSYVTAVPGTFKQNIQIDCGNNIDFNNCNIGTSDPTNDGADKSLVLLNTNTSNIRFYNTTGNSIFTDSGTLNCTALDSYYKKGSYTTTLTGCSATITGTAYYTRVGNAITLDLPTLTGTSNDANKTLTGMPTILSAANAKTFSFFGSDNGGAYGVGMAQLSAGVFTLSKDGSGTTWTSSGTFTMRGPSISYTLS